MQEVKHVEIWIDFQSQTPSILRQRDCFAPAPAWIIVTMH